MNVATSTPPRSGRWSRAALLGSAIAAGCAGEPEHKVIVLVVDGIRLDESLGDGSDLAASDETWPRVRDELGAEGAIVNAAYAAGSTLTTAAHVALFSGSRQPLATLSSPYEPGAYRPDLPGLGEALRSELGLTGDEVRLISNGDMVRPLTWSLMPGFGEDCGASWEMIAGDGTQHQVGDGPVFDRLEEILKDEAPRLTLVNLKEVDRKGHYSDLDSYLDAAAELDASIADLWEQIQRRRRWEGSTTLVVTSDHGRHRSGEEAEYWRNHGDPSDGDREIPMLLIGPGIEVGVEIDAMHAQEDLAPTLAALLGAEMPWADGWPIVEAMTDPPAGPDAGPRAPGAVNALAADDGFLIEQRRTDDPAARSQIWWGDALLSDPDAWAAEAPAVAAIGDGTAVACWREIRLDEAWMPWTPRCARLGESIESLPSPEERVGPFWRPSIRAAAGTVSLAYAHNPDDIAGQGLEADVGPRLAHLGEVDWQILKDDAPALSYPAGVVAGGAVVAFAAMPSREGGQYERGIYVQVREGDDLAAPTLLDLGVDRAARPVLQIWGDGALSLLALGYDEAGDQRYVLRIDSDDAGLTWGDARIVTSDPELAPHLAPIWAGDRPGWVAIRAAGAELCFEGLECLGLGGAVVEDLGADADSVFAAVEGEIVELGI